MSKTMIHSGTVMKRCVRCFSAFGSPFSGRTLCVKCKPTTPKELDTLLNHSGAKIVNISKDNVHSLVV